MVGPRARLRRRAVLAVFVCQCIRAATVTEDTRGPEGVEVLVTTLAGKPLQRGYADGVGTNARFDEPQGCAVSADGNYVYVADTNNHAIRSITVSTGEVGVLAGNGQRGSSDGVGSNAAFSLPRDVAIDPQQGNSEDMYVADYANCAVRRLDAKTSNVESTTGHCATSRTSEMICPPVGDIVTIIRFAPSTDQGTDNSIRFRLGWNIGSGTNEGWGPYQVRPGPFPKTPGDGSDPNYVHVWDETNTREWNYTSAEIPNAIRIETMGDVNPAGSGDDPYVGVLEVSNLCGANFPIFNEMDDYGNTLEALPIGQEKTYTWTQLERSPFLTTGPVSVSVLRLARAREGGVVVADRNYLNTDGTVRIDSDWELNPTGQQRGNAAIQQLGFGGFQLRIGDPNNPTAGYLDGQDIQARFDAHGVAVDAAREQTFVADDQNYCIRRIVPPQGQPGDSNFRPYYQVDTYAGDKSNPGHQGGSGTNAQFTRVRRLAISPDGDHMLVSQSHWSPNPAVSQGVLRLIDMRTDEVQASFGPSGVKGHADGYGTSAQMNFPTGLSFFPDGDRAVVCDSKNFVIRLLQW